MAPLGLRPGLRLGWRLALSDVCNRGCRLVSDDWVEGVGGQIQRMAL